MDCGPKSLSLKDDKANIIPTKLQEGELESQNKPNDFECCVFLVCCNYFVLLQYSMNSIV